MPFTAKLAVKAVASHIEQDIGEQGLQALDKWLFSKSAINESAQARLQPKTF